MKEIVRVAGNTQKRAARDIASALTVHIGVMLAGFVASRAVVADKLLPFGSAFLAGASLTYTPAAAIGVFAGYFFPAMGSGGFRYLATLFALLAVKLLIGGMRRLAANPIFLSLITFLASILTSAASLNGIKFEPVLVFCEGIFAAGGAFFTAKAFKAAENIRSGPSADGLAAILCVTGMLLLGINGVSLNGISLGHILGIAVMLAAAKYGGILSGSVCGIAVSFEAALGGTSGVICAVYAFAGLTAGLCAPFGKYVQATVILIFTLAGSFSSGDPVIIAAAVIEAAVGSALFLCIPRRGAIALRRLFSACPKATVQESCKKSVSIKLNAAAGALHDVSETVEQVAAELSKINSPDFGTVISLIEQDACAGCKLRMYCWESRRDETLNAVLQMTNAVKQCSATPENAVPDEFKGRCLRTARVASAAYKRYSDYSSRIAAEKRIDEVRGVVSDQFSGISELLLQLATDVEKEHTYDEATAQNAAEVLKSLDMTVTECTCGVDKYGRMTLEIKIKKEPDLVINKFRIMKMISVAVERDFGVPVVNSGGNDIFIVLTEHASLRVDVGVGQKSASESSISGDAYKYFYDGRGHFVMILSDGMGTGGRAAVDGAMASGLMSRLIKAGFGYDTSLKILNSSMLFKSTDESLATVDIASIDLFNGKVELFKAGAAPTLIRRSGRTGRAESSSLPAGILRDIGFDKAVVKCREEDIVLLMSDGAVCEGTDWIKAELEKFRDGTAEQLAECICDGAKRRRSDSHEDDITVIAAIIKKSV